MKPSNTKPSILALDLDDTLLQSDYTISKKTIGAIKKTKAMGLTIVLASGHLPEIVERYARLLGLRRRPAYLISNNGALITESHTGNVVYESILEEDAIRAICDMADTQGFPLQMYSDNITYISRKNEYSDMDEKRTRLRQVLVANFRAMLVERCYRLIIPGDPQQLARVDSQIQAHHGDKISTFISRDYFLQVLHKGVNKGRSLAKVAEIMGLGPDKVMAVGDSMSDAEMIRWAGIGVAMANGDSRL